MTLVLASQSPRRKMLLEQAGFEFEIIPSQVIEAQQPEWTPEQCAMQLAQQKAQEVCLRLKGQERYHQAVVLGADTVVALDNQIFGKPQDRQDAFRILRNLSQSRHRVITGVSLFCVNTGKHITDCDVTYVTMRQLTEQEITAYIDSGEGMDKAGGYAIQETADNYITKLEGAYDNVVGLPITLVKDMLRRL